MRVGEMITSLSEFKLCLLVHLAINNPSGISCLIFAGIPLALTHIVLGHRSTVGGNIDSVLLLLLLSPQVDISQ